MPKMEDMTAVPRKVKPLVYLVELVEDQARNEETFLFLRRTADRVQEVLSGSSDLDASFVLYAYGTGCTMEPHRIDSDRSLDPTVLRGEHSRSLSELLLFVRTDLNRARLNYLVGCHVPTIYLLTEHGVTAAEDEALQELMNNRWFSRSKRWVIHFGELTDRNMTMRFVDKARHIQPFSQERLIEAFLGHLVYRTMDDDDDVFPHGFEQHTCHGSLMDQPLTEEEIIQAWLTEQE